MAINDFWCFELTPVWMEFNGHSLTKTPKVVPFLSDTILNGWAFMGNKLPDTADAKNADLYALVKPNSQIKLALTKNQV